MKLAMAFLGAALTLCAAGIDGRWSAELAAPKNKAVEKKSTFNLDLKSEDGKVTGSIYLAGGKKKARPLVIRDGRIDGNRLTFTTELKTKKADVVQSWTATLDGDRLTGTRSREGAKRGQSFTAKRM